MPRQKGQQARSKGQVQRDKAIVASLYMKGHTQSAIGEHLTRLYADEGFPDIRVSQTLVWKIVNEVIKDWEQDVNRDITAAKAIELAKLNDLELDYRKGWDRSLRNKKKTATKQKGRNLANQNNSGLAIQEVEQSSSDEEQVGDPRFLDGIRQCIDRRIKLLGLDAPIKSAHSFDFSALTDSELAALREKYKASGNE